MVEAHKIEAMIFRRFACVRSRKLQTAVTTGARFAHLVVVTSWKVWIQAQNQESSCIPVSNYQH